MLRRGALAAICAAVLAFAGCGTDDEAPAGETPAPPRSFFGVAPQGGLTAADLERMAQGRVGTVRIFLPWGLIDPTSAEGDYDLAIYDTTVLEAARNDIEVLPFMYGTPSWVAQELDGVTCETDCDAYAPTSEAALHAWGEFVGAVVDRYGPNGSLWAENPDVPAQPIRAWQIWNEQNSPSFYQPQPDVASYAKLLDTAAHAIRSRDEDAQVILGGMFGTPLEGELPAYSAWDYLRRLYEIEGTDGSFDGIAAHPYAAHLSKVEEQTELMHDEVVRAGDADASLWITEIGWASSGGDVPLNRGPEGQAESLTQAFDYFLAHRLEWNIQSVTWYSWRDTSEMICDWCGGSGLFPEGSDEPKPAWEAFVALTGGS